LRKEHPEISQWNTSPAELAAAVSLLCDSKVQAWQLRAEQLMRRYQILQWLQQTGGDNCRSEHKHMRKQRNLVSKDMQEALRKAVDWEQERCKHQQSTGEDVAIYIGMYGLQVMEPAVACTHQHEYCSLNR